MPKIILINGSCHENGNTSIALKELSDELNRLGVDTEMLWLGTEAVPDCIACKHCSEEGICTFNDGVNRLNALAAANEIDGIVAGSPVYYGGPSGRICSFLDRLFYAGGENWAGRVGASVVVCRRGGATAAFQRLNNFFLMNNMIMPSSQYWNQVHGRVAGDAALDAEGLQTMRTLARNMAYVLEAVKNVPKPEYEERVVTNFIR